MTGAPVKELQYKHEIYAVLEKVLMVTSGQTGVVPRHVNLVPKTNRLGGGIFLFAKKTCRRDMKWNYLNGNSIT